MDHAVFRFFFISSSGFAPTEGKVGAYPTRDPLNVSVEPLARSPHVRRVWRGTG